MPRSISLDEALAHLDAVNEHAILAAGPRYSPGLDPSAPNIEVDYLVAAFEALSLADGWRERLGDFGRGVSEAVDRRAGTLDRIFRRRTITPSRLIEEVRNLEVPGNTADVRPATARLHRDTARVNQNLQTEIDALMERRRQLVDENKERDAIEYEMRQLRGIQDPVEELLTYLAGTPGQLLQAPKGLLLLGSWGTGKTHLLCDVARQRLRAGKPALLLLASELSTDVPLIDGIADATGLAESGDELLRDLNALGDATQCRTLLMIDAINEGDRVAWRKQLSSLAATVEQWPNVRLVVSCRRPFDEEVVTDQAAKRFVSLEHFGFQDQEFDAQLEYFRYYDLPAPSVPLLTPEFSRPLFLKILCEGIKDLAQRSQRQKLREIASGQKGMTYVLERYTKKIGVSIENDLGLPRGICWRALKGVRGDGGLAGAMADHGSDWLPTDTALTILKASLSLSTAQTETVLRRLVHDGLLAEQMHWRDGEAVAGVQFAYQRFGDHLIARHLLEAHLITDSEQTVKRCFYANKPLGRIFQVDQWSIQFVEPGIASAIMLEFPERMKRASLPRELLDYLPKRARYVAPLRDAFLDGLYWRPADSFTQETDWIVEYFLTRTDEHTRYETFEVLVGLATRPAHPYSAGPLATYLSQQSMAARDTTWSEYLRQCDDQGNVQRILAWIEGSTGREEVLVRNEIRLLSLFLTTTRRPLRDRVTRALVLRGSARPDLLFDETLRSLAFNDPYVSERMLAASYGVAMRLWADPSGEALRRAIVPFARSLVRHMFFPNAPYATKHVLRRGYALGAISLARQITPRAIATRQVALLRAPFAQIPTPFVDPAHVSEADAEDGIGAMRMDFANYTLGRLFSDRGNYDDAHPGYQDVRRQIAKRMSDLGYSTTDFQELDRRIAERQPITRESDGSKTDRYGKKYAWIAFFEMYGVRGDLNLLRESRSRERSSDADVDPSFPVAPREWMPPLAELFESTPTEHSGWLAHGPTPSYGHLFSRAEVDDVVDGPWVLLNGFIEESGSDDRETFTYVRGLLMKRDAVGGVRAALPTLHSPGNSRVPEPWADYYTYAGEIPWSSVYASDLRRKDGHARRHRAQIFERFEADKWTGSGLVEVPIQEWNWESYHSVFNDVSGIETLAPALCEHLNLVNHDLTFDLWDQSGGQATVYREFDASDGFRRSSLLYLREDLLERYLTTTGQVLVWISWGERTVNAKLFADRGQLAPEAQAAIQSRRNAFAELVEWN